MEKMDSPGSNASTTSRLLQKAFWEGDRRGQGDCMVGEGSCWQTSTHAPAFHAEQKLLLCHARQRSRRETPSLGMFSRRLITAEGKISVRSASSLFCKWKELSEVPWTDLQVSGVGTFPVCSGGRPTGFYVRPRKSTEVFRKPSY